MTPPSTSPMHPVAHFTDTRWTLVMPTVQADPASVQRVLLATLQ